MLRNSINAISNGCQKNAGPKGPTVQKLTLREGGREWGDGSEGGGCK